MLKKTFLTLAALFFIACCLTPNPVYAGWHEWSQRARNYAILEEAYRDLNKKFPELNCKLWVQQRVVKNASNGETVIPATVDPPGYYWYASKYVMGRSGLIENANPGEIVQMKVNTTKYKGPHTAIVWARSPFGVTLIELECRTTLF